MKTNFLFIAIGSLLLAATSFSQSPPPEAGAVNPPPAKDAPAGADKRVSQSPLSAFEQLGASFATSARIGELQWSEEQFNAFATGVSDGFHHRNQPFDRNAQALYAAMTDRLQSLDHQRREEQFQDPKYLEKFIRDTRKTLKLQQADSGLCYIVAGADDALRPTVNDTIVVSFDVTASDLKTDLPQLGAARLRVKASELLPGLVEAVQMMSPDSRGVFLLPPSLSYGTGKWPKGVDKNSPLIYRVTLHEIQPASAPSS